MNGELSTTDLPRRLFIFGAGGSGRETAWLARDVLGPGCELSFLVDREEFLTDAVNGLRVQLLADVQPDSSDAVVVALGDPGQRQAAVEACSRRGLQPMTLVHPRAEMSEWVQIGVGSVICAGTTVTTNVIIGDYVQVNVGCTISHDVHIDDLATISPGVHVSGHVRVGASAQLGAGATIINGRVGQPLTIGEGAVIAAGACVTKSVEGGALVAGVPAVRKR